MSPRLALPLCILSLLALAASADAQDRPGKVDEEVTAKTGSMSWYEVRDGKTVRGGVFNHMLGYIVGVAPDYFLIHWRGHEGWVKRSDVVLGEERFKFFTEQAKRNPSDGSLQRMCADYLMSMHLIDVAQPFIEAAVRLTPQDATAHQTRGVVLAIKGNSGGAESEFAAAEQIDPADPATYAARATMVWQPRKDYTRAEADFDKALHLAPADEMMYVTRADYWMSRQDAVRALADLDTAIRLWPDCFAAHFRRAELLMTNPDRTVFNPKEAVVSARKVCELSHWEGTRLIRRLAKACESAGYNDEAKRWQDKAEQMEKGNAAPLPPLPK